MTHIKHTEGPWEITGDDSMEGVPYIEINSGVMGTGSYKSIAHVQSSLDDLETTDFYISEEDRANSRLIASAPDMLNALEEAKAALVMTCLIDKSTLSSTVLEIVEAAISKATT